MSKRGQQDARSPGNPSQGRIHLARAALAAAGILATVASGCDCHPARSKPWRHAREPVIEVGDSPARSEVVAAEARRVAALRRREHTLRVLVDAQPRHLNPMVAPSVWTIRIVHDTVFETLIRYQPPAGGSGSGPGRYQPGLAQSWQISPGGRELRIDLQPEVSFHDGRRLSSMDVQFSIDTLRGASSRSEYLRDQLADIAGVDLVTARTVRIRLNRANGYILRALAEVPIVPAHVYRDEQRGQAGPVVGSGPYRFESWADGVIRLTGFSDYWGSAPAIEDLEFVYEPDAARALTTAKRGELDLIPALIPEHYPEQASSPGLASDFDALRLRPATFRYLVVDVREPPFDDVRVRTAVALLFDRKGFTKTLYDGLARPVAGPVWPGGPGDGPAPAPSAHDPAEAGRLLDAAGWRDGDGDGRRERDGVKLAVSLLCREQDDPERELIVAALRRAGFQVELRRGTSAVLLNRLRAGDFDLAILEWAGVVDQDLSPLVEGGGSLNFGGFADKQVDHLLSGLRAVWEPASRAPLMADLAAALASTTPLIPIVAPDPYGLLHKRVRGAVVWNGWLSLRDLSFRADPSEE